MISLVVYVALTAWSWRLLDKWAQSCCKLFLMFRVGVGLLDVSRSDSPWRFEWVVDQAFFKEAPDDHWHVETP